MPEHFDVIIIGTGAGGGTLAHTLRSSGKRVLLLERRDFLPREMGKRSHDKVFIDGKYISKDTWYDGDGTAFQPQVHYFVGGATKLYGAALYRLRPGDFGELRHVDGISPAWPVGDDEFTKAERLYQVHGTHGEDPTDPVLDVNCKAHQIDNLYVVDTSFFPSIGAVNPALTAIANAAGSSCTGVR